MILQASFTDIRPNTELVLGIRIAPDGGYIARGSHYSASATSINNNTSIGELMNYTSLLIVPSAGYQVRFTVASASNAPVLANETGATGSGNVTNVTIQKL